MARWPSTIIVVGASGLAFVAGQFLGRNGKSETSLSPGEGVAVLRFGDRELRADQARAALSSQRIALRAGTGAAKEVVEDLARTRILALRAVEKGYDRDPEVVRRYAETLATLYLEKELGALPPPTEADLRAYLEENRGEFALPERTRVALISFAVTNNAERAEKRAKAAAALKEALARRREYYAFGELARARSEDPRTAARNGELGEMTREALAAAAGPEVAAAAFAMSEPGIHETVIESASGFHVLRVLGREEAYEPRLEDVRDRLAARLASERREARRKALIEEAWKEAKVAIDEVALETIVAELRSTRP